MAKIKPFVWSPHPIGQYYFAGVIHNGDLNAYAPNVYHEIIYSRYEYNLAVVTGHQTAADLNDAYLLALDFLALPELPRRICRACRGYAAGPNVTQWNITRGENLMIVPPTIWTGEI